MFQIKIVDDKSKEKPKTKEKPKPKQKKTREELKKITEEKKQFLKDKTEFEQKFYRLMLELGLYNKFNRTYWLRIVEKTNYGFYAQLYLEEGLGFSEIKQKIGNIQESLCCIWIMKTKQFQKYADIQIVTVPMDEDIPFEPPKIKQHQMYLGMSFSFEPIIINMYDYCMYLMAGATGSGKTILIYQILLSWIMNCTPQEVEIYLGDIAKNEYVNFEHVKHVKFYASELEQLDKMIEILMKEFERRKKLLSITRAKGIATGIKEYNQVSKNKLSTIIILQDEFSVILPDKTDNKEEKEMKQRILDGLKFLSKTGRNLGLYTFEALQKTVKEEIPSIIKSQSAVRISLRANDSISSEVIMGDHSAVGLGKRYAVYSLNGGEEQNYLYSPYLDTKMLNDMLEPYIDEKFKINKIKSKNTNNKPFDSNIVEITTVLKPISKDKVQEYIDKSKQETQETKLVCLKGGEFIDY